MTTNTFIFYDGTIKRYVMHVPVNEAEAMAKFGSHIKTPNNFFEAICFLFYQCVRTNEPTDNNKNQEVLDLLERARRILNG